jgi:hypothetical protein
MTRLLSIDSASDGFGGAPAGPGNETVRQNDLAACPVLWGAHFFAEQAQIKWNGGRGCYGEEKERG